MPLSELIKKLKHLFLFFYVHVNKALPKDHLSRLGISLDQRVVQAFNRLDIVPRLNQNRSRLSDKSKSVEENQLYDLDNLEEMIGLSVSICHAGPGI